MVDMEPRHLALLKEILRKEIPDRSVWLFGSRAKGGARPSSDADLAILGEVFLGFERLGALREAFEESDLPFKVDLVDWATTSEEFRQIIERNHEVIQ